MHLTLSDEATSMVERAKEHLRGMTGNSVTTAAALDWLLRDAAEYGSATVGSWARQVWPESAETASWNRKHGDHPDHPDKALARAGGDEWDSVRDG